MQLADIVLSVGDAQKDSLTDSAQGQESRQKDKSENLKCTGVMIVGSVRM